MSQIAVCEIGTGEYPIVPLLLWLMGVDRIQSIDISPITTERTLREVLDLCDEPYFDRMAARLNIREDRLKKIRGRNSEIRLGEYRSLFTEIGINLKIADLSSDQEAIEDCDFVISNNVLEHIDADSLSRIAENLTAVENGIRISSHEIDLADHYGYFDKSIGPYNFLKYSDSRWRFFDNKLTFQNRLRASDYRRIFTSAGWTIEKETANSSDGLDSIIHKVDSRFERYDPADLATTNLWLGLSYYFDSQTDKHE